MDCRNLGQVFEHPLASAVAKIASRMLGTTGSLLAYSALAPADEPKRFRPRQKGS
jgi:hypothetical protein